MTSDHLNNLVHQMKTGETVTFRLQRSSAQIDLTARGEQPRLGALYYPTGWYPVLGGICLGIGLLTFATRRRAWRSAIVLIVGLGLAVGFYLTGETGRQNIFLSLVLYQRQFRAGGQVWAFHQSQVGMTASLALALLAFVELCWLILRRAWPNKGASESV